MLVLADVCQYFQHRPVGPYIGPCKHFDSLYLDFAHMAFPPNIDLAWEQE